MPKWSKNSKQVSTNNNKYMFITIVLIIFNFIAAMGIIYTKHINRISMAKLNTLVQKQDSLYQEWTQLVLEQNTLISYGRVDKVAKNKLKMHEPKWNETKIISFDENLS